MYIYIVDYGFSPRGDGSGGDEGGGEGVGKRRGLLCVFVLGGEVELWCGFFWWYGR